MSAHRIVVVAALGLLLLCSLVSTSAAASSTAAGGPSSADVTVDRQAAPDVPSPSLEMVTSRLHPLTLVRTIDALRDGRRNRKKQQTKKRILAQAMGTTDDAADDDSGNGSRASTLPQPPPHLRRIQEEEDGEEAAAAPGTDTTTTCEDTLAEAEAHLEACQEYVLGESDDANPYTNDGDDDDDDGPSYLFVQMADDCTFQTTDSGNTVLKSRNFHGDTVLFSDRPFEYAETASTEFFFENFADAFNDDNGGQPNAAITLVTNDESKDIVVSVFVKAVVHHKDNPDGPTYVYKLGQSDEQAAVKSLSDVMGDEDKITYDHCSIFIDSYSQPGTCGGMCWHDYQCSGRCDRCQAGVQCYAPSPAPPPGIYTCGSSCQNDRQCASGVPYGAVGGCPYCENRRCSDRRTSQYQCGSRCQNDQQCASGVAPGVVGGCRYCANNQCSGQPAQQYRCGSPCNTNAECKSGVAPGTVGGCPWCYRGSCSA